MIAEGFLTFPFCSLMGLLTLWAQVILFSLYFLRHIRHVPTLWPYTCYTLPRMFSPDFCTSNSLTSYSSSLCVIFSMHLCQGNLP